MTVDAVAQPVARRRLEWSGRKLIWVRSFRKCAAGCLELHAQLGVADRGDADGGGVLLRARPVGVGTLDDVIKEGVFGVVLRIDHPQPGRDEILREHPVAVGEVGIRTQVERPDLPVLCRFPALRDTGHGLQGEGIGNDEPFVDCRVKLGFEGGERMQRIEAQALRGVGHDKLVHLRGGGVVRGESDARTHHQKGKREKCRSFQHAEKIAIPVRKIL